MPPKKRIAKKSQSNQPLSKKSGNLAGSPTNKLSSIAWNYFCQPTVKGLTAKQIQFCEALIENKGVVAQAARSIGCGINYAYRLTKMEKIQSYIEQRLTELSVNRAFKEIVGKDVIEEMAVLAFSDIRTFMSWSQQGILVKGSDTLPLNASKAISEITFVENEYGDAKNRRFNRQVKIKLHDKKSALESLAKMLGMFSEDKNDPEEMMHKLREMYDTSLRVAVPQSPSLPQPTVSENEIEETKH